MENNDGDKHKVSLVDRLVLGAATTLGLFAVSFVGEIEGPWEVRGLVSFAAGIAIGACV